MVKGPSTVLSHTVQDCLGPRSSVLPLKLFLRLLSWEEKATGLFGITVAAGTTNVSDQRLQRRILWSLKSRHAEILLQWRHTAEEGISNILTQPQKHLN